MVITNYCQDGMKGRRVNPSPYVHPTNVMFRSLPAIVVPGEDTQETSYRATRISITWIVQGALHAFASSKKTSSQHSR